MLTQSHLSFIETKATEDTKWNDDINRKFETMRSELAVAHETNRTEDQKTKDDNYPKKINGLFVILNSGVGEAFEAASPNGSPLSRPIRTVSVPGAVNVLALDVDP